MAYTESQKLFYTQKNLIYQSVNVHGSKYVSLLHPNQHGIEQVCITAKLLPVQTCLNVQIILNRPQIPFYDDYLT